MATDNTDQTTASFKVVEVNGNLVVEDAAGNIVGQKRQTDEQKAALAAAKEAQAAAAAAAQTPPASGDQSQDGGQASDNNDAAGDTASQDGGAKAPDDQPVQQVPQEDPAPTPAPTPAPVVEQVQTTASNNGKPIGNVTLTAADLPVPSGEFELPLSASASARLLITELKEYITKMSSKVRMNPTDGGQAQTMLYHILLQAVNTKAEEFDVVFGLVMKLIRANLKGCFSDQSVHRYTPHVTLSATQASTLRYLLNVLTSLADPSPEARKIAMRQVNIEQALGARIIKEEARQRVMAFFNYQ